jgi:glycosyltransferase involved in cell wall biosynthesis
LAAGRKDKQTELLVSVFVVTEKSARIKEQAEHSPVVMIATDSSDASRIPASVRLAGDLLSSEEPDLLCAQPQGNATGVLVWAEGDTLVQGVAEDLRGAFLCSEPTTGYVAVNLPCLLEADFVALDPRCICNGAAEETLIRTCRIRATPTPSASVRKSYEKHPAPWARLHSALLHAQADSGIDHLKQLWQELNRHPLLASLVLRNLALALMKNQQIEKADELLKLGMEAYPGYADFLYLSAVSYLYSQKPAKAMAGLERAMQCADNRFVSAGGENSYRASWLLGTIFEEMGDQRRAASAYFTGVLERPAFPLSVDAILRQRFSLARALQMSNALCEMVRRETHYLAPVFDFFLAHRAFDPARRLLRTLPLAENVRDELQTRLARTEAPLRLRNRSSDDRPGVFLEGPFLSTSGHARINLALGKAFLGCPNLDAALEPSESATGYSSKSPDFAFVAGGFARTPKRLDLTIRHCWPPDFARPECGRLACILPWEHRAVPRAWVREIERSVDELWVPSRFVADAFVHGGVNNDRVHVVPNGFAPDVFNAEAQPWLPSGCRSCVFLFVGGAIRRKGADLLLQAYLDAFSPDDDVTLIFKDTASSAAYQHNNVLRQIRRYAAKSHVPDIRMLTERMDDARLASLYRGCTAFVLPYRGEGFCMPLIEAMACSKPVVTTAAGPAIEFCSNESAYLIPANEVSVRDPPPPFGAFTSDWTWFEPDLVQLAATLRSIYENSAEAARRGAIAAQQIARTHAWPQITRMYLDRIAALTSSHEPAALSL